MGPPSRQSSDGTVDLDLALHQLPVGAFVIDRVGTIAAANEEALRLVERSAEDLLGTSILDLVHPDDSAFTADVLAAGPRFPAVISGPVYVRYVTGAGAVVGTRLWSRHALDVEGINGYVITFSPEAAEESLYRAVMASVTDSSPRAALEYVAAAFGGAPFNASAALVTDQGNGLEVIGCWPFAHEVLAEPGPWRDALDGKATYLNHVHEMPESLAALTSGVDIKAIWGAPVTTADGRVTAAIVVWREMEGEPSPNQGVFLDQAAMIASLALDQASHRMALEQAAFTDPLTGLGNRSRLARVAQGIGGYTGQRVDRAPALASVAAPDSDPTSVPAGVLYVDLDGFKVVNDTLGHAAGDRLLAEVATRLVGTVRTTDEVIRVGGDEFVILCHEAMAIEALERLAERVIEAVSREYDQIDGHRIELGASVGIDSNRTLDLHDRIRRADAAMYTAKAAGRGRWHHSDDLES